MLFTTYVLLLGGLSLIGLDPLVTSGSTDLQPIFNVSECITAGTLIALNCTVNDTEGYGATVWSGSHEIFNCSSFNTVVSGKLFLSHLDLVDEVVRPVAFCGDTISGRLNDVINGSLYTSTIYLLTTLNMNGGYVRCTDLSSQTYQEVPLRIEGIHV